MTTPPLSQLTLDDSQSEHEVSDVENGSDADSPLPVEYPGTVLPDLNPESIDADADLTTHLPDTTTAIDLIQLKIKSLGDLQLARFTSLESLCLRQNLLTSVHGLANTTLTELDVYDNRIDHISKDLNSLTNLTSLDFSFNKVRNIRNIDRLVNLTEVFFVQNKIAEIKNLGTLTKLTNLELGGNRIVKMEGLETLERLEQLWVAKNRIVKMEGMHTLSALRILSIQSNRITTIEGLEHLVNLEELYISHNKLTKISGLDTNLKLTTLDVTGNQIATLSGLSHLEGLTDLWASYNQIDSFENIHAELSHLALETVYFEGNPVQKQNPVAYTRKVKYALGPALTKIDANYIK